MEGISKIRDPSLVQAESLVQTLLKKKGGNFELTSEQEKEEIIGEILNYLARKSS